MGRASERKGPQPSSRTTFLVLSRHNVPLSVGPKHLRQLTACAMQLAGLANLTLAYHALQNDTTAAAFMPPLPCSTFQVSRAQCA